jgi:hypothetical protein
MQDELRGLQLGGAPPTWTQEGGGTRIGESQLPDARPTGTQVSGGTQPSPGGLPGSSHQIARSVAVMATPHVAADASRPIHPRDPLTYPCEQTRAAA